MKKNIKSENESVYTEHFTWQTKVEIYYIFIIAPCIEKPWRRTNMFWISNVLQNNLPWSYLCVEWKLVTLRCHNVVPVMYLNKPYAYGVYVRFILMKLLLPSLHKSLWSTGVNQICHTGLKFYYLKKCPWLPDSSCKKWPDLLTSYIFSIMNLIL